MNEIKKILIPVDFSNCSLNALEYGANLGRRFGAEILLIHCIPYNVSIADPQIYPEPILSDELEEWANNKLKEMETKLGELVTRSFAIAGNAVDGIEETVYSEKPDLVLMGTEGASGLNEFFIGSTASNVIHRVKCPVLVVPGKARYVDPKNILFLFDYEGFPDSPELKNLKLFSKEFSSYVHILHVKGKNPPRHFDDLAALDAYFNTVKHSISSSIFEHFRAGVNDFILENEISLLAIYVREHNFFERLFRVSKTDLLAFHSEIPLLAIHE